MKRRLLLKSLAALPFVGSISNLFSKEANKQVLGKIKISIKPRTILLDSEFPDVQMDLRTGDLYKKIPDRELAGLEFREVKEESTTMATIWMSAKYDSKCVECESDIYEDDRIVWDTNERKAYCSDCGKEVAGLDPRRNHV